MTTTTTTTKNPQTRESRVSMTTLYGRRKRAVEEFRETNGPVTSWPEDRFGVYLDLIDSARAARWHHLRTTIRRTRVCGLVAYIAPLYALTELAEAVSGATWWQMEVHLTKVDGELAAALVERDRVGDHDFTARVTRLVDRCTNSVTRMTNRFART
ncbi:hypothetical protein [Streptomyces sp. NPDC055607]